MRNGWFWFKVKVLSFKIRSCNGDSDAQLTPATAHAQTLAAISSVQHNSDLHDYYQRKVGEGKNKMSVINAVRNKLLHRIVAVIKRGTPYELSLKNN